MVAGDADEGRADLAVGHQLGFLEGALDRSDGRLDVDHHALLQSLRLVPAHAEDLERGVRPQLGHQAGDLRGADIQRHDEVLVVARHGAQPFGPGTRKAKPFG
jgi:hypothetical protein